MAAVINCYFRKTSGKFPLKYGRHFRQATGIFTLFFIVCQSAPIINLKAAVRINIRMICGSPYLQKFVPKKNSAIAFPQSQYIEKSGTDFIRIRAAFFASLLFPLSYFFSYM
jgi:hypothetical protein